MSAPVNVDSRSLATVLLVGAVGAVWISLIGLFVLAITHDGAIATQVANSALALVGAAVTAFSSVAGLHIWVNRPAATATAPAPVTPPAVVTVTAPATVTAGTGS